MAREAWKPVKGYEGFYEISDQGRVKSLCAGRWHTTMIRKLVPDKDGYLTVCLKKDGKVRNCKVHRLVAEAFIPNDRNLPEVNHKDENKQNNSIANLEWCTGIYNLLYNNKPQKANKRVCMLDDQNNVLQEFPSINAASNAVGISPSTLSTVLSGRRKNHIHAGGYKWKFKGGI